MKYSSDRTVAKVILWLLYTELCEVYFLDTTPPPLLSSSEDEGVVYEHYCTETEPESASDKEPNTERKKETRQSKQRARRQARAAANNAAKRDKTDERVMRDLEKLVMDEEPLAGLEKFPSASSITCRGSAPPEVLSQRYLAKIVQNGRGLGLQDPP